MTLEWEALPCWEKIVLRAKEMGLLDGLDFVLIQNLAARLKDPEDLAFRITIACLLSTIHSGGLRIPGDGPALAGRIQEFLTDLNLVQEINPQAEAFTQNRLAGNYTAVMGQPPDYLPLLFSATGLYFQKHYSAESNLVSRLGQWLQTRDRSLPADIENQILDTVLVQFPLCRLSDSQRIPMVFDPKQIAALKLALQKKIGIISGGPGTGKTSLTTNLLRTWVRAWWMEKEKSLLEVTGRTFPRIRIAAPTGRAAQRMAESIQANINSIIYSLPRPDTNLLGMLDQEKIADQFVAQIPSETIHSLLRYNPGSGEFFYQSSRPLPADLVIIDEVSMVDIFVLSKLINALEDGACLVLIGDGDQLPSVDSGSILADLIPGPMEENHPFHKNLVMLTHSHRSQANILDLAHKVNSQDIHGALASLHASDPLPSEKTDDFKSAWHGRLQSWLESHFLKANSYSILLDTLSECRDWESTLFKSTLAQIFTLIDQSRILTFTRKSWYGCTTINSQIRNALIRLWDPKAAPSEIGGFHGSPILILENEYSKGLFNGDVGVFLRLQGRAMGFFRRGNSFLNFPAPFLPRHEMAFAMTIHKSQGSEYDHVLLVLPESGNRLLYKETLYTAITRARISVSVYGSDQVLEEAISRKVHRESGLSERLKQFPLSSG